MNIYGDTYYLLHFDVFLLFYDILLFYDDILVFFNLVKSIVFDGNDI
jgi:hypothetical protein